MFSADRSPQKSFTSAGTKAESAAQGPLGQTTDVIVEVVRFVRISPPTAWWKHQFE